MKTALKLSLYLPILLGCPVYAQVVTDGSLGAVKSLSGQMTIPQNLGQIKGSNLFHSFKTFNINSGESATFTGSDKLKNVISRVTGGEVSTINGLLKSDIGNANFYFINPAGLTFGKDAQVDVPAAFHVSTADSLKFVDEKQFSASNPGASSLTIADPVSFGFLGNTNAQISINGAKLSTKPGQELHVIGGNLSLENAKLKSAAGAIKLQAIGLNATDAPLDANADKANGDLAVNASTINVSGNGSGELNLQGGRVDISNASSVAANNNGATNAGTDSGIYIKAGNLSVDNSTVKAGANESGDASGIHINSGSLNILNGALITTSTYHAGDAGHVEIQAKDILIDNQDSTWLTGIASDSYHETLAHAGNAGTVSIKTDSLQVLNSAQIGSNTWSTGNASDIQIKAGSILVDGNGENTWISSATLNDQVSDAGDAGTVSIHADSLKVVDGGRVSSGTWGTGNAGLVKIQADNLRVFKNGQVSSSTEYSGNAGQVQISAKQITVDGQGDYAFLTSNTNSERADAGDAGSIGIKTHSLNVLDGGVVSSSTWNSGNAGNMEIDAANVLVDGKDRSAWLASNTNGERSSTNGQAGTVAINSDNLTVRNGGEVSSSTWNAGNAGNVEINADAILLEDGSIFSATNNENIDHGGDAGTISINSHNLTLLNAAEISSSTWSTGAAGNILIDSDLTQIRNGAIYSDANLRNGNAGQVSITGRQLDIFGLTGKITSSTYSRGNAGSISIDVDDIGISAGSVYSNALESSSGDAGTVSINAHKLAVLNSGLITSNTSATGNAGSINIDADNIVLDKRASRFDTGIFSNAKENSNGNAGTLTINSKNLSLFNDAEISSSTWGSGNAGSVTVNSEHTLINNAAIYSDAKLGSGNAGQVNISGQTLDISGINGKITSDTSGAGNAGSITIDAEQTTINGGTIYSDALDGSKGNAGKIAINAKQLKILSSGQITSSTYAQGNAGSVTISANQVLLDRQNGVWDTGIFSNAKDGSSGNAGEVTIGADNLAVLNGAQISSSTLSSGKAGGVQIDADAVLLNGRGNSSWIISNTEGRKAHAGDAGSVSISANSLKVLNGGNIGSSTWNSGDAGDIRIDAAQVLVDGRGHGAWLSSNTQNEKIAHAGNAGTVSINGDKLSVLNGGIVSSLSESSGNAGSVYVNVNQTVVDGQGDSAWIVSNTQNTDIANPGTAGLVSITGKSLSALNGGEISSSTWNAGDAGGVEIGVEKIVLDGKGNRAWLASNTNNETIANAGNAGSVTIKTSDLSVLNGGTVSSYSQGTGNAGSVNINAENILVDGKGSSAWIISNTENDQLANAGNAGVVSIQTDKLRVLNGGEIGSNTWNTGAAGDINIKAEKILVDGKGNSAFISTNTENETIAGAGNAGTVNIKAGQLTVLNEGVVSSSTDSTGNAGNVEIHAGNITVDGQGNNAWITSNTENDGIYGAGNAGSINIGGDSLSVLDGGRISSSTWSTGKAGNINIGMKNISLNGKGDLALIGAEAYSNSWGQSGSINITTDYMSIADGGLVSISSEPTLTPQLLAELTPTRLSIKAKSLSLSKDGKITAASSGNVPASDIAVKTNYLTLSDTKITTEANNADAGKIDIDGNVVKLRNSQITTSVANTGDGGDIGLNNEVLVLYGGFIQANTSGVGSAGGDITINVDSLVTSYNQLVKGGEERLSFIPDFNVIQAASPDGVSGDINVSSPQIDISGSISGLSAGGFRLPSLSANPCRSSDVASTLARASKGGVPVTELKGGFIPPAESSSITKPVSEQSFSAPLPSVEEQPKNNLSCTPEED